jgi:hypothetical protein
MTRSPREESRGLRVEQGGPILFQAPIETAMTS